MRFRVDKCGHTLTDLDQDKIRNEEPLALIL